MTGRKFHRLQLVIAYELRTEGHRWKVIARRLGCSVAGIRRAVLRAIREGLPCK